VSDTGRADTTDGGSMSRPHQDHAVTSRSSAATVAVEVEDLFLRDDLKAIGIPWVDRLLEECDSHTDLARVWTIIRCWGPDGEDIESMRALSVHSPPLEEHAEKARNLVVSIDRWRR
jgi:hypothetical protein